MKSPDVTIIIPYNKDRGYLHEAVKSAESQAHVIPFQGDALIGTNINAAMKGVTTRYVAIMAEDDLLPPGSVFFRQKALEETGADFIHGRGTIFFSDGREMPYRMRKKTPNLNDMVDENQICGGTPMYLTDVFQKSGGFDEALWTAEEYEFHMKLLSMECKIDWCDRVVYNIRVHDGQKSIGVKDRAYQNRRIAEIKRIKDRYRGSC